MDYKRILVGLILVAIVMFVWSFYVLTVACDSYIQNGLYYIPCEQTYEQAIESMWYISGAVLISSVALTFLPFAFFKSWLKLIIFFIPFGILAMMNSSSRCGGWINLFCFTVADTSIFLAGAYLALNLVVFYFTWINRRFKTQKSV